MKYIGLILLNILFFSATYSQTIVTIDGEKVDVDEFKRMYEKNTNGRSDYSQENLNEYLDLFINYRLKLREAHEQGIDKDPEVLKEIAKYEDQLVRNDYEEALMSGLVDEAKSRLNEEICMKHILIDIPSRYKNTGDTIYSYNQALEVRKKFLAGQDWDKLVEKNSRDMETKYSGGDLGCFSTLQLSSYELENAAYSMKKGQVSMPIRTKFGYHIIYVTDRRPNQGIVSASQLFIRSNNNVSKEEQVEAQQVINEAYTKLNQGNSFQDVGLWIKGQPNLDTKFEIIQPFTVGTYDAGFENAIIALKEVGDYSRPYQSSLGWHIFKLDSKEALPSADELESKIREKIQGDERYQLARMHFGESLKSTYAFQKNDSVINLFINKVAPGISVQGWQLPTGFDYNQVFFKIDNSIYTAQNFVNMVKNQQNQGIYQTFDNYYNQYETNSLINYHKNHLVQSDPEMRATFKEYRDGIVLFRLMQNELWDGNEIKEQELKQFYEKNKDQFKSENRVTLRAFITKDKRTADKIENYLKRGKGENPIRKLNRKNAALIDFDTDNVSINDAIIQSNDLKRKGAIAQIKDEQGNYIVYYNQGIEEGQPLSFNDAKSQVTSSYNRNKEAIWLEQLKEKYPVSVNNGELQKLYH